MHELENGENRLEGRELPRPATPTASRPLGTSDVLHHGSLADRARKDSVRLAPFASRASPAVWRPCCSRLASALAP
jgi:hypothetical protein